MPGMRVLFIAGRELSYPRNDVLLRAFRRFAQVEVIGRPERPRSLLRRSLRLGLELAPRLVRGGYDLVFVGFYGHFLMLPAGMLSRRPVLFDAFVSTYDTLADDRKTISPASPAGRLAYALDRTACRLAAHTLLDTELHADYFARTFSLPRENFSALPVGCNEDLFYPQPAPERQQGDVLALYYTGYMPLHGVDVVIEAADRLRDAPLHFRLIGDGPTRQVVQKRAGNLGLDKVEFVEAVPLEALPGELARADICLGGHFGGSEKAGRVAPGKVYQVLAMRRPLLATSTPANQALLEHGVSAYLCPPQDPEALASALQTLAESKALRDRLADGGYRRYRQVCSEAVITHGLKKLLEAGWMDG